MAQTYSLVVELDDASLRSLTDAGFRLVVAKPAGNAAPNVAWLAAKPQTVNRIEWDETYGLYAAEKPPRIDEEIEIAALLYPAADQCTYPYTGGRFGEPIPTSRIPRAHYDVRNDSMFAATFGLVQTATINAAMVRSPLNAVVVPPDFNADFTSMTILFVWAQQAVVGGSVITTIPNEAAIVRLSAVRREAYCWYDHAGACFVTSAVAPNGSKPFGRRARPPLPQHSRQTVLSIREREFIRSPSPRRRGARKEHEHRDSLQRYPTGSPAPKIRRVLRASMRADGPILDPRTDGDYTNSGRPVQRRVGLPRSIEVR